MHTEFESLVNDYMNIGYSRTDALKASMSTLVEEQE